MTAAHSRWDAERAARWLERAEGTDVQLQPVSDLLFAAAAPVSGERALDVGCGHGPTTRVLAGAVGPTGSVTGLDSNPAMIEAAASIPVAEDDASENASITWSVGDATNWEPPVPGFDLVLSRFGMMFFDDPLRAFTNLASLTRAGGRLAMATWAVRDEVELFDLPYRTARRVLVEAGEDPAELPNAGGPYSLPDRAAIGAILEPAGWVDIEVHRADLLLTVGGGLDPHEAAVALAGLGPARFVLEGFPNRRAAVVEALTDVFEHHRDDGGEVVLGGRVAITTARRP